MQVREDRLGRVDPDVGGKKPGFEFLEQGGIDAPPRQEVRDP
jgi:hypothetical protein